MTTRKTISEEFRKQLAELEVASELDDDHLSIDSVYDSDNNDAPYIPEDISSDSDSDSCDEPLRKKVCCDVRNSQPFFALTEQHTSLVRPGTTRLLSILKLRYLAETSISGV